MHYGRKFFCFFFNFISELSLQERLCRIVRYYLELVWNCTKISLLVVYPLRLLSSVSVCVCARVRACVHACMHTRLAVSSV